MNFEKFISDWIFFLLTVKPSCIKVDIDFDSISIMTDATPGNVADLGDGRFGVMPMANTKEKLINILKNRGGGFPEFGIFQFACKTPDETWGYEEKFETDGKKVNRVGNFINGKSLIDEANKDYEEHTKKVANFVKNEITNNFDKAVQALRLKKINTVIKIDGLSRGDKNNGTDLHSDEDITRLLFKLCTKFGKEKQLTLITLNGLSVCSIN